MTAHPPHALALACFAKICDKYYAIHAAIYAWFGISFDKFGRTPTRAQTEIGQEMFMELHANGRLVAQSMEQLYSEPLQKFLADRFVVGTCPKCRYEVREGAAGLVGAAPAAGVTSGCLNLSLRACVHREGLLQMGLLRRPDGRPARGSVAFCGCV